MNTTAFLLGVGIGAAVTAWLIHRHHQQHEHNGPGLSPNEIKARMERVGEQAQRLAAKRLAA